MQCKMKLDKTKFRPKHSPILAVPYRTAIMGVMRDAEGLCFPLSPYSLIPLSPYPLIPLSPCSLVLLFPYFHIPLIPYFLAGEDGMLTAPGEGTAAIYESICCG